MFFYLLYKLGEFIALHLPLKLTYWLGERVADIKRLCSRKDRNFIKKNLKVILGEDSNEINRRTKELFRNFAKYLIDFLRFSRLDKNCIGEFVRIEGKENVDRALLKKKGVIVLAAHIGNWELGGVILSILGYPMNVLALEHESRQVNDFFINQRAKKGVKVISLGSSSISMRGMFSALERGELVAVLGDRDFSGYGLKMQFFGRPATVPRGPGSLCLRTGALILPGVVVRQPDDTYTIILEKPIEYEPTGQPETDLKTVISSYLKVFEKYIRRYPSQWFMFTDFWTG